MPFEFASFFTKQITLFVNQIKPKSENVKTSGQ